MVDNLNVFAEVFEKIKTIDSLLTAAEQNKNQFGSRFIVLPNPMYGAWEDAVYGEGRLTDEQKAEKRKATLRGY
jgi:predicted secreted acid phosphatase